MRRSTWDGNNPWKVKKLSSRIESATLLDDRRDSVRAIRSLSRKYRREVTDIAMGNLIELIKTESDGECLSSAIEAICSLVCADEDDFTEGQGFTDQYEHLVSWPSTGPSRTVRVSLLKEIFQLQKKLQFN